MLLSLWTRQLPLLWKKINKIKSIPVWSYKTKRAWSTPTLNDEHDGKNTAILFPWVRREGRWPPEFFPSSSSLSFSLSLLLILLTASLLLWGAFSLNWNTACAWISLYQWLEKLQNSEAKICRLRMPAAPTIVHGNPLRNLLSHWLSWKGQGELLGCPASTVGVHKWNTTFSWIWC